MHLHLFPCTESLPVISCRGFCMECLECGQCHLLWITITPVTSLVCVCVRMIWATAIPQPTNQPTGHSLAESAMLWWGFCCVYACLFVRLRAMPPVSLDRWMYVRIWLCGCGMVWCGACMHELISPRFFPPKRLASSLLALSIPPAAYSCPPVVAYQWSVSLSLPPSHSPFTWTIMFVSLSYRWSPLPVHAWSLPIEYCDLSLLLIII